MSSTTPASPSVRLTDAATYSTLGFAAGCPGCGTKISVSADPACPKCMILLTVAPGVRMVALATFVAMVMAFGAAVGASMLAVYMLHEWIAGGEPSFGPYSVMLFAQAVLFSCAFHGIIMSIGLIERVRLALLRSICLDLAGAWAAAAFILWQVRDNVYFGF